MAHKKFDVAQQFATGTGTGALTPGAVTSAMYRTFAAAGMVEADTCYVRVQNASVAAEWQVCLMTLTAGTFVFTFDDFSSSATGSQISFSSGTKIVSGTIAAAAAVMLDPDGSLTIEGDPVILASVDPWIGDAYYAGFGLVGGVRLYAQSATGHIAITGVSRASDSPDVNHSAIGLCGWGFNDGGTSGSGAWGGYFEARKLSDGQDTLPTHGVEIDICDASFGHPIVTINPNDGYMPGATMALWVASGGGITTAQSASLAIGIVPNTKTFQMGLMVHDLAIATVDGVANAIALSATYDHRITWWHGSAVVSSIYGNDSGEVVVSGDLLAGANIDTGIGVSTGTAGIEIGGQRTGNGIALIDFHAVSGSDYDLRIIRNGGTNGAATILNGGSGYLTLQAQNISSEAAGQIVLNAPAVIVSSLSTGYGVSTGTAGIEIGGERTDDGYSLVDLHSSSGVDYSFRILRDGGTNGNVTLVNAGSGNFYFGVNGTTQAVLTTAAFLPATDDALQLGSTSFRFSDIFFASGAVVNFAAGNYTVTHSSGALTFSGAMTLSGALTYGGVTLSNSVTGTGSMVLATSPALVTPDLGVATATSLAIGGATLGSNGLAVTGSATFSGALLPVSNDAAALGSATLSWSDAFFASGAVLNFANGNFTVTHSNLNLNFSSAGGNSTFTTTGTSGARKVIDYNAVNSSPTANDEVYFSYLITNSTPTQIEAGRQSLRMTTVTASSEESQYRWLVRSAGSLATKMVLNGTTLTPGANDGTALGTGATSWSDLFLASGAVLNFNNGNYTATHSSGILTFSGSVLSAGATSGVGYATGAGGTVTQATSKSTGVTLNKVCGQITMNNAALAADAKVTFTVTNSAVATTDVVIANIDSGGTADAYLVYVTAVGAGSFNLTVENATAGSLSEAPVISFAVMKGVTS